MKWLWMCVVLCAITGCAAPTVYETVDDGPYPAQQIAAPGRLELELPDDCWMQTFADGTGAVYAMEQGEISLCVLPSGPVEDTLRELTGLSNVAVMPISAAEGIWEAAWATTAEQGVLACRTGIWERDGYHYCVSMMMPEDCAEALPAAFKALVQNAVISSTDP